jgi:hypothetical protein
MLVRPDAQATFDGALWVQRSTRSIKRQGVPMGSARSRDGKQLMSTYLAPTVISGFRVDGTYLGDVRFPPGVQVLLSAIVGDFAWAISDGADGTPYLVKYRLH